MNRDDPFAEPTDTDKTVIRPNPGGRLGMVPPMEGAFQPAHVPAPAAPAGIPGQPEDSATEPLSQSATGFNPLVAAASALFMLVGRIRNRAQHSDPGRLRDSVVKEIRAFETHATQAGLNQQSVKVARYALCATLDDVVLNTPWGDRSIWAQQSMVGTFHRETHGGDRFYELLERLQKDPSGNRDLLEFLYMCLTLGFEGRLRVDPRGAEKHLAIRDRLAHDIRAHRGPLEQALSPRWAGIEKPLRMISAWVPVWLVTGATAGLACLTFFAFSFALSFDTERFRGQLLALGALGPVELARAAPPPPPPPPTPQEIEDQNRIETFLAPEIAQGLVQVLREANVITVRITGRGMFGSGSDVLEDAAAPIVDRVARALNTEAGAILVAGHSDNIPINTARFPSNAFLSLARAQAVMTRMSQTIDAPERLSAEGRADTDPIASNDTAEGRAQNRRIDVILVKAGTP